jgi:hypothetical protein
MLHFYHFDDLLGHILIRVYVYAVGAVDIIFRYYLGAGHGNFLGHIHLNHRMQNILPRNDLIIWLLDAQTFGTRLVILLFLVVLTDHDVIELGFGLIKPSFQAQRPEHLQVKSCFVPQGLAADVLREIEFASDFCEGVALAKG